MPAIPERQPLSDLFGGVVLQAADTPLLARAAQPAAEVIAQGDFVIRYGIQYLGKPHFALVPGLVALDYGDMLVGEAAWDFLLNRSNLHPRADVVGFRNDGVDDMIAVKYLDLAEPVHVQVYADAAATQPIIRVRALIASSTRGLPPRLLDYLPCFESLEAWRQHE
ncbi:MAG: hypothetical protein K8J31_31455 [Anaerolineae bacterium]|nr:hypothetical protein [Anaerolineae bacterium]